MFVFSGDEVEHRHQSQSGEIPGLVTSVDNKWFFFPDICCHHRFRLIGYQCASPDSFLPIAHTCFFSLDLPFYTSFEILRKKVLYASLNCTAIDIVSSYLYIFLWENKLLTYIVVPMVGSWCKARCLGWRRRGRIGWAWWRMSFFSWKLPWYKQNQSECLFLSCGAFHQLGSVHQRSHICRYFCPVGRAVLLSSVR